MSYIYIFIAVVLWGLWGYWGKLALDKAMPPVSVFIAEGLMGFTLACCVIAALKLTAADMPWDRPMNLYGFLSGGALAMGIGFYYLALETGKVSVIVPATATYPAVTVLLAFVLLGERLTGVQWLGLVAVVIGCACLLSDGAEAS